MTMLDQCRSDMALMLLLFSSSEVAILFEVSASRACILAFFFLQSLLSFLFYSFISDIFVMCVS